MCNAFDLRRVSVLSTAPLAAVGLLLCAPLAGAQSLTTERSTANVGSAENLPDGVSTTDWASIRAAYEAGRHAAHSFEGGYKARNPGQGWVTTFDGRGFTTQPDGGAWTWGLQLEGFGFAGHEQEVCEPLAVRAAGQRVTYDWDGNLEEWWINDARGLEHGYTIQRRPAHAEGQPLDLRLAVRGELSPRVQDQGRDVQFVSAAGAVVVNYSGLTVFDADGRVVDARFEHLGANVLRLRVDEREARYPLTIDPIAQQAYLKASNTDAGDEFGSEVSVSGDTVVVGAPGEASNATGVNGNQADNSATNSGAAYVFVRTGATWSQQAYLKASNTDADDRFGSSVSASVDTVVVGAVSEASSATGVNGFQGSDFSPVAGAAYVFVRSGTTWSQQAYLKASNTDTQDQFGSSVAISGNTVVVGAQFEDSQAIGVNGDESNNLSSNSGAAYVFVRSGTTWSQQAYLKASNTDAGDNFGREVAISGDTLIVGCPLEASNATGVNGNQADNSAAGSGAAYVFVRSGATWSQQAYLKASNAGAGDRFGASVAISTGPSGFTAVVGASEEDSSATGVNGNQSDDSAPSAGAAYVFLRSGTTWSQQAYLKASNTGSGDDFGVAVSISADTVVIGALREDSGATGVNGSQADNTALDSGAAYVFVRSGTSWSQQAYLKASNTTASDNFGDSVAISGDTVMVGAPREDSNATGVNGNEADNSALTSGAAYVFYRYPDPAAYCFGAGAGTACPCGNSGLAGNGCANSLNANGANLAISGTASVSNDTLAVLGSGMPNGPGLYFQGTSALGGGLGVAFGDGLRCVGGTVFRLGIVSSVGNASTYPTGVSPNNVPISIKGACTAGSVRNYQLWYRDSAAFCTASTFNLTNAINLTWVP